MHFVGIFTWKQLQALPGATQRMSRTRANTVGAISMVLRGDEVFRVASTARERGLRYLRVQLEN